MKVYCYVAVFLYVILMSFTACFGCTVTFTQHNTFSRVPVSSYWTATKASDLECKRECAADINCAGYGYISSSGDCTKSQRSDSSSSDSCSSCYFHHKNCETDCLLNYTYHGHLHTTKDYYSSEYGVTFDQCEAACSADSRCLGFGYDDEDFQCFKSDINIPEETSEDEFHFSTKHCFGDVLDLLATPTNEQVSKMDTTYFVSSETIQMSTVHTGNSDTTTMTSFESSNSETTETIQMSTVHTGNSDTTTMTYFESSNSETTSMFAEETGSLSSLEYETSTSETRNATCKEICFYPSNFTTYSIENWKEEMKTKLTIIKDELSANKRKLKCASDPRYSSRVVGLVGIAVLFIIGAIIVIPDLMSAACTLNDRCKFV